LQASRREKVTEDEWTRSPGHKYAEMCREQEEREKQMKLNHERIVELVRKLMDGKPLTPEQGRRLVWEFFSNVPVMKTDPMTGNSRTYHILGQQQWAREKMQWLKQMDISLYQKMEREAVYRETTKLGEQD